MTVKGVNEIRLFSIRIGIAKVPAAARVRFNLASYIDLTMAHCQLTIAIDACVLSKHKWSNRITLCTVTARYRRLKDDQKQEKLISLIILYNSMSILSRLRLLRMLCQKCHWILYARVVNYRMIYTLHA